MTTTPEEKKCVCGAKVATPWSDIVCSHYPNCEEERGVEEIREEVAAHLQHLLTIAEGKEEIEQWNLHAANLIHAVTKTLHQQLQKAQEAWFKKGYEDAESVHKDEPQKAREEFKERIDGFLNGMKAEINISNEYKLGYRQALLDLKEAYHSELDQEVSK